MKRSESYKIDINRLINGQGHAKIIKTNTKVEKQYKKPKSEYHFNSEIYNPYVGAAGMLLHRSGQFTIAKWNASLLN